AALLSLAHGPHPQLIASAATSGKAILGALAMSTGAKAAAAVAALLLLVVGLVLLPQYLARSDREAPRAPADRPASNVSRSVARADPAPIQARPYSESEP